MGVFLTTWGSVGSGDGQFNTPFGIAVDASGNIFVADTFNHRIQQFSSTGVFITKWGTVGTGNGQFKDPIGITVNASGGVYVADLYNFRIQLFRETATLPVARAMALLVTALLLVVGAGFAVQRAAMVSAAIRCRKNTA